jgi:hypothetical protein
LLLPIKTRSGALRADDNAQNASAYIYERDAICDQVVFGKGGESWTVGTVRSDAAFLFVRREAREIVQLAFCAATFVEIEGTGLFASDKVVARVEWTAAAGASSSDPQSSKQLNTDSLRSRAQVS